MSAAGDSEGEGYFEAYHDVGVHELMIKDQPRMEAYAKAVQRAEKDIRGKVVVDVGCGTGILSLLCARAGARKARAAALLRQGYVFEMLRLPCVFTAGVTR